MIASSDHTESCGTYCTGRLESLGNGDDSELALNNIDNSSVQGKASTSDPMVSAPNVNYADLSTSDIEREQEVTFLDSPMLSYLPSN